MNILTVVVLLLMFYVFFRNIPWCFSEPISSLSEYKLEKNQVIPKDAKYFTVGHGKATFFRDSKKENPIRFYGVITLLLSAWVFLIVTNKEALNWLKFKKKGN